MVIVVGVTGGIAAYKAVQLVRLFVLDGHDVHVVPTDDALRALGPAQVSPRRTMHVTAVHSIHGTASSFMCSQVDSFTAEIYAAQPACPVQS